MSVPFTPSREAGLERLTAFVPRAGRHYREQRNHDRGADKRDNVSSLSPYLRYRLITEREVIAATLEEHSASAADKFISEVVWRTYWKGWLQLRPGLLTRYEDELAAILDEMASSAGLRDTYARAIEGRTGIDAFDHWANELVETGYVHNHARMWFASIWVFTLGLPWQLGADVFLRHLVDGDVAVNLLSWRWVAGLQTRGKAYAATAGNIGRYTDGRFDTGALGAKLARGIKPLSEDAELPKPLELPAAPAKAPAGAALLLLHEDDLAFESLALGEADIRAVAVMRRTAERSPLDVGPVVEAFAAGALADTAERARQAFPDAAIVPAVPDATALIKAARAADLSTIITPEAPVGPVAAAIDAMRGDLEADDLDLITLRRPWDDAFWPHATAGFFRVKKQIAPVLKAEGLTH